MKVLMSAVLAAITLNAQERETMGGHFATEYLVGPMAHNDGAHQAQPYVQKAMKIAICPPIFGGWGGLCIDPVELVKPLGKLIRKKSDLSRYGSTQLPARSMFSGVQHQHAPPTKNLAVDELEQELKKSRQMTLTVTCQDGVKLQIQVEATAAPGVMKSASDFCPAVQVAKKD